MNEIELLRQYGQRSASSAPPDVEVTAAVLATLRSAERSDWFASTVRPLVSFATATWVLALVVGFFVQQAWSEMQDPLTSLLTSFGVALQ
jgi:hypothetical protein